MTVIGTVVAQATDGSQGGSPLGFLLPVILIGGVFYVLLVLPQRRRVKQLQALRESLGPGDQVRTVGGIYGTIREDLDDSFVLDVGSGTTLRVAKRAIAERVDEDDPA